MFYNLKTKPNTQYARQTEAGKQVLDLEGGSWNPSVGLATANPDRYLAIGAS